jgi:hypothetical protein
MSYPLLVQPVLDRHCVRCHGGEAPRGEIVLTAEPQEHFMASYRALAPRVSTSCWRLESDWVRRNCEPLTWPGFFGALGSPLMEMLEQGHHDVDLGAEDWERLITWMDANAPFYGTFDVRDQERQLNGERIEGPALE